MQAQATLILGFLVFYSLLFTYSRSTCWRDPTSAFFQAERAHEPTYSGHRIEQSLAFADRLNAQLPETVPHPPVNDTSPPQLCVGIPSVERDGISYLKSTLGSLQEGLTEKERDSIYFVVFLAHIDQQEHNDYNQPWLVNMADALPMYSNLDIAKLMVNQNHGVKAKFDYSVVLDECEKTGAPYILMIEDDVVFMDGWWHRTGKALDTITSLSWGSGHDDFLYLRLFYYEGLLGWNSESWRSYTFWSIIATTAALCASLTTRRLVPSSRPYLSRLGLFLIVFVFTPMLIVLYFLSGGNCVDPRPTGVHLMPDHACCGQGLVFPRTKVTKELLPHFRRERWSDVPTDSFIERHADATGGLRYALTPVVMQHVGGQSSHNVNRGGGLTPTKLWNFNFEKFDAAKLATEHKLATNP
ncbi:hypothetical protein F5Y16DRAFT_24139 [Xylariaceae sp. FL0255]|nr:hypothetical protein F5Y16DRAFT_24139 [Xylariaceae sp. FL0255]